jgi:small multidrug resistance pump
MVYLIFAVSIFFEVIATSMMKKTEGFTILAPSVITIVCYCISFYAISIVMKTLPVGIVYAIWSAVGIILVSMVAYFIYGQKLDLYALLGMAFIITGVVIINVFSNINVHS